MIQDCLPNITNVEGFVKVQTLNNAQQVVDQFEVENAVMDETLDFWKAHQKAFWLYGNYNNGTDNSLYNRVSRLFASHVLLTNDSGTPSSSSPTLTGDLIGWASRWPVGSPNGKRGNLNPYLSSVSATQSRWVFEWSPQNGNGTFQTVAWGIVHPTYDKYTSSITFRKNMSSSSDGKIALDYASGIYYLPKKTGASSPYSIQIYSVNIDTGQETLVDTISGFTQDNAPSHIIKKPGGGWVLTDLGNGYIYWHDGSTWRNSKFQTTTGDFSGRLTTDGTTVWLYCPAVGKIYTVALGTSATYTQVLSGVVSSYYNNAFAFDGTNLIVSSGDAVSIEIKKYSTSYNLVSTSKAVYCTGTYIESASSPMSGSTQYSLAGYPTSTNLPSYPFPHYLGGGPAINITANNAESQNYLTYNKTTGNLICSSSGVLYDLNLNSPSVVSTKALLPSPITKTTDHTLRVTYDINFS